MPTFAPRPSTKAPRGLTRFRASGVDFETTLMGRHGVMNLLAAIAVARVFDIAPERLRDAVRSFPAGRMRGERTQHRGVEIWNDCYNSNPEAAQSMIDALAGRARAAAGSRCWGRCWNWGRPRKNCTAGWGGMRRRTAWIF